MIHKIKIQKIKTKIFILLALRALNKILDSLIYLDNFKILNTLKSLNVFRDKRLLEGLWETDQAPWKCW